MFIVDKDGNCHKEESTKTEVTIPKHPIAKSLGTTFVYGGIVRAIVKAIMKV